MKLVGRATENYICYLAKQSYHRRKDDFNQSISTLHNLTWYLHSQPSPCLTLSPNPENRFKLLAAQVWFAYSCEQRQYLKLKASNTLSKKQNKKTTSAFCIESVITPEYSSHTNSVETHEHWKSDYTQKWHFNQTLHADTNNFKKSKRYAHFNRYNTTFIYSFTSRFTSDSQISQGYQSN